MIDLRELRRNKGLSIRAAAKQIGVSPNTLQRAETATTVPQVSNALKIAEFYDLAVTDLWPIDAQVAAA